MQDTEKPPGLIARSMEASARRRVIVFALTIMLAVWGVFTPAVHEVLRSFRLDRLRARLGTLGKGGDA